MTDPTYTALMLIIDRSGSMQSIRDDMVGGLENLLAQQAALQAADHPAAARHYHSGLLVP